jgi:curved DNA-binding protein CbpA
MSSNYIKVDGKFYDPYYILEVSEDDSLEFIIKAYKSKAKKYHPDKAKSLSERKKNEKRFKILLESIEFIKNKRENADILFKRKSSPKKPSSLKNFESKDDIMIFNKNFKEKTKLKESTSDSEEDISIKQKNKLKERNEELKDKIINQFSERKFSNSDFNIIFDYVSKLDPETQERDKDNKKLIHYTTDGFYGYNTSDLNNFSIVRSFNGLLINDDIITHGENYSNFKEIYKKSKNPNKLILLTEKDIKKLKTKLQNEKNNSSIYIYENENENEDKTNISFMSEQKKLYKKSLRNLEKQQKEDENIILKSDIYNKDLIENAKNGILDMSPSLLRALDDHYKIKRIM